MFTNLTTSFTQIIKRLTGSGKITQNDLDQALAQMRNALVDADVALAVVDDFIGQIKTKALGQEILRSVSASQMIIKVIHDEMVNILSSPKDQEGLILNSKLSSILMVGLQGSGKTTSTAKLAAYLKKQNKKILLISCDTYRPAAREQLKILAETVGVDFFQSQLNEPLKIASSASIFALEHKYDIAIFDTAGRLQIDQEMIQEVKKIEEICLPCEVLLVVDSLSGQDALNIASQFSKELKITGSILTRLDGDARGGAILSVRHATNKPIKFLGAGEKTDTLELFDAKRVAGRIIGMGDVVSFVEQAAASIDKEEAEKAAARMQKGQFTLEDYLSQIRSLKKMGGIANVMKMMPGAAAMQGKIDSQIGNKFTQKQEAIILSMTKKERKNPIILNSSRKSRIAKGSGSSIAEVQKLLKNFENMSSMIKKASKMNLSALIAKSGISGLFS